MCAEMPVKKHVSGSGINNLQLPERTALRQGCRANLAGPQKIAHIPSGDACPFCI